MDPVFFSCETLKFRVGWHEVFFMFAPPLICFLKKEMCLVAEMWGMRRQTRHSGFRGSPAIVVACIVRPRD